MGGEGGGTAPRPVRRGYCGAPRGRSIVRSSDRQSRSSQDSTRQPVKVEVTKLTVKGDVRIGTINTRTVAIQTFSCPGNSEAAKRCRDRDFDELAKEGKYQALEKHETPTEDGDITYSISWLVD